MALVKFSFLIGAISVLLNLSQEETDDKATLSLRQLPKYPVYTGEQVTLTCEVQEDSSGWQYHWYKIPDESKVLNSDTSISSYIINSAELSHNGAYSCHVKREGVSFKSENHKLVIEEPPQPKAILDSGWEKVFPGEKVTLKCEIPKTSLVWIYVWLKDSKKISGEDGVTAKENLLLISSIKPNHHGNYACEAEVQRRSKIKAVSSTFLLTVYDKATLSLSHLPHYPVYTGEQVTLTCKVEEDSSGWQYHWYKIPDESKVLNSDTSISNYIINSAELSHNGAYSCHVKREGVSFKSQNHELVIEEPPQPKAILDSGWEKVFPGEKVTLKCEIPKTSLVWIYVWLKDSKKISGEDGVTAKENLLLISSIKPNHHGNYACEAEVQGRSKIKAVSSTFLLTVYDKATLSLSHLPHYPVYTGEQVTLTCKVEEDSSGWQYHWYKIPDESKVLNSDTSISNYIINSAELLHNGAYSCHVKREGVSFKSQNHELVIEEPPQPKAILDSGWEKVFPGEKVTLKCEIPKTSLVWIYVWLKDSKKISGEDGVTAKENLLLISSIKPNHHGNYACEAEVQGRSKIKAVSSTFPLTVYDKATLSLSQLPNFPVMYTGEQVTLTCNVEEDSSGWQYHWYKIPDESKVLNSDTSNSSYIINSAELSHNGAYSCHVKREGVSFKSQNHKLVIEEPPQPKAILDSGWEKVFPGEKVTLQCEVPNTSLDWIYVWFRNSMKISSEDGVTAKGNLLSISSIKASHGGNYSCQTETKGRPKTRAVSTAFLLTAYANDPTVHLSQNPPHKVMYTEEQVTLTCKILESSSGWEYKWYRETDESKTLSSDTNYTIDSAQASNNGTHKCKIKRGENGREYFASHNLTIRARPAISLFTETSWSDILSVDSLTLKCEIIDTLEWNYTWYKDEQLESNCTEQKCSVKAREDTFKSEYKCRGNRTQRPLYTSLSNGFKANNIVLKRQVLLSFAGCVVCFIILLFIGCIVLRYTRKPEEKLAVKEDLFFSMTASKTQTSSPFQEYMMENEPIPGTEEYNQTAVLLNKAITIADVEEQIKTDDLQSDETKCLKSFQVETSKTEHDGLKSDQAKPPPSEESVSSLEAEAPLLTEKDTEKETLT
ncbi:Fc receptor-like protein 5 [Brachyhypopomus gauderio]|uniref:Fc receptor-like protein 5 n=1 Tax=Brachyhypopomus gauderio TaxID=698409 RepID=UPI004042BC69